MSLCLRSLSLTFPVLLLLAGCAGRTPAVGVPSVCYDAPVLTAPCFDAFYARYSPLVEAATITAVGFYLSTNPERIGPMYDVIDNVRTRIAQEELTSLAQLEAIIHDRVNWDALPPASQLSVKTLLSAVRVSVEALLKDLGVAEPAQVRVVLKDVVDWVYAATLVQCASCLMAEQRQIQRGTL